jgi:glutathione S-transferase
MKLYWAPHTCAIGTHILLEEIGRPYETERLEVKAITEPPFRAINPKGKVPTLRRDDGSILTEYGVIAYWLANSFPEAHLTPDDDESVTRMSEMMDYAVGTVHMQGFARIFMPQRFEPQDMVHQTAGLGASSVKAQGREMVENGFRILSEQLGDKPYCGGEAFSIGDSALFYCERWAPQVGIELPTNLAQHLARMRERPAVRRVLEIWGEPLS